MTRPVRETLTVVCYDIADNRRRYRVVRVLEGYGVRVQESVFECWLKPMGLRELRSALKQCIDDAEDYIGFYALSERERREVILLGSGATLTENPALYVA